VGANLPGAQLGNADDREGRARALTSGPYRFIRHPIYSGILLALLGTALATNLYWLIVLVFLGAYFTYSATVEERLMTTSFPDGYASYKAHTKMLIPFVL
jgi:protein-S-isoprenylcysteine O-methyltransferase Ste14